MKIIDMQNEKLLKRCGGLIKKCMELDRAKKLSKKKTKDLTKSELKELQNLDNRLLRWCIR